VPPMAQAVLNTNNMVKKMIIPLRVTFMVSLQ
jgi:hypothetical protein